MTPAPGTYGTAMPRALPLDAFDIGADAARARFEWAARRGHPRWLWPDTTVEAWQAALAEIALVSRQVLTEGRAKHVLGGEAMHFGIAGYTSGMGPLLGSWLRRGLVEASPDIGATLELHYRHNALRMEAMARRATQLVERLAERGVRVIVLKGMDTAWSVFADPGERPVSDIDLTIDPDDRTRAGAVLRELGYRPGHLVEFPPAQNWRMADAPDMPRSLALVHADDPWSVDLQTSLNRRYSSGAPVIELDRLASPATLAAWSLSPSGRTLAAEARAVHLACHASCGLLSLSLMRLVELVMTIRAGAPFSWQRFVGLAEQAQATAMTWPALDLAEQLAPGTVPADVLLLCRGKAPLTVRRVIDRLTPHSAQRVLRCSLEERFMWTPSRWRVVVQVIRDVFPPGLSLPALAAIYRGRARRLRHGTITR
jgi:hypothetical protein